MSAVRPRDPGVRAEPWAGDPVAVVARATPVIDLDQLLDAPAPPARRLEPPDETRSGRPTWTVVALAGSSLAAPWGWAVLSSRLPLPAEQQGLVLLAGWLGMAVAARVLADPRRDR